MHRKIGMMSVIVLALGVVFCGCKPNASAPSPAQIQSARQDATTQDGGQGGGGQGDTGAAAAVPSTAPTTINRGDRGDGRTAPGGRGNSLPPLGNAGDD